MDLGPPISSLPDIVTFEVVAGVSSANDFSITCSHEDLTSPALYNTAENHSSQDNILPQNSEQNQYTDD